MENLPVKSDIQKMIDEEIYNGLNPELVKMRKDCKELCYEYNHTRPSEEEKSQAIIKKLFKKTGNSFCIEPNFFCDYGFNISIGENFYSNHNLVILDVCEVFIGDNVFFGPNCGIYTAGHPIDVVQRNKGLEFGKKIRIGNNVWLGGNVIVLPGVTIGNNVTIGAGSVVTKDIPDNVTAFGNPCKVRKLNKENEGVK